MTICSVYPIEIITGEWGAIQILPVPCPPLIEVALYITRLVIHGLAENILCHCFSAGVLSLFIQQAT